MLIFIFQNKHLYIPKHNFITKLILRCDILKSIIFARKDYEISLNIVHLFISRMFWILPEFSIQSYSQLIFLKTKLFLQMQMNKATDRPKYNNKTHFWLFITFQF